MAQPDAHHALRTQIDALNRAEAYQREQQETIATSEDRRRDWITNNPLAQHDLESLSQFHNEALRAGHADTSDEYFGFLNSRLAELKAQHPSTGARSIIEEMQERTVAQGHGNGHPQRTAPNMNAASRHVSAPVSREPVSFSYNRSDRGRITLTDVEREHAKISGVSEAEYARQKIQVNRAIDEGKYSRER